MSDDAIRRALLVIAQHKIRNPDWSQVDRVLLSLDVVALEGVRASCDAHAIHYAELAKLAAVALAGKRLG